MKTGVEQRLTISGRLHALLLRKRWPWHLLFWLGYVIFRFWLYYVTVQFYAPVYLEYMLLSEILFVGIVYYTLWLYRRQFEKERYSVYFIIGALSWLAYLYGRTEFQFYYLKDAPGFQAGSYVATLLNSIGGVIVYFLFITSCKYFKDGYIRQQATAEKKGQQLMAEVANLKSQIAPHFLFNTLNNLYGLAVDKSDKLPDLMLRLSDILRHSLYEAEKPLVTLTGEIAVLKSYIELESIRLEDNLQLAFTNNVANNSRHLIAPLILLVFVENAFKHARFVQSGPINIAITSRLEGDWFTLSVQNNYNKDLMESAAGIGLVNVKRRLEVLYPTHRLMIRKDESTYSVDLSIPLTPLSGKNP
jgi:sensor histidine kinase YesM